MSSRGRLVVGLAVAAIFALTLLGAMQDFASSLEAQSADQYYSETGHWVRSPFYEFLIAHGDVAIFGYPITEQLRDADTGTLVQYFQRVRMEASPQGQVTLTKLGVDMGYRQPALRSEQIPPDSPYQRYFPVTGHTSAYAFLSFWDKAGGEAIFGYPITEPVYDGGRLVQYFERARMEWWPERAPGQRVGLTSLGVLYAPHHVSEAALRPVPPGVAGLGPTPTPSITELAVVVSVKYPVTRQAGTQTVSVLVSDQMGNPIRGATVQMSVKSSLSNQYFDGLMTSEQGIVLQTFPLEPDRPGKPVIIDVTVSYGGLTRGGQSSYMPWWP